MRLIANEELQTVAGGLEPAPGSSQLPFDDFRCVYPPPEDDYARLRKDRDWVPGPVQPPENQFPINA